MVFLKWCTLKNIHTSSQQDQVPELLDYGGTHLLFSSES
jgi:hypothetical protein